MYITVFFGSSPIHDRFVTEFSHCNQCNVSFSDLHNSTKAYNLVVSPCSFYSSVGAEPNCCCLGLGNKYLGMGWNAANVMRSSTLESVPRSNVLCCFACCWLFSLLTLATPQFLLSLAQSRVTTVRSRSSATQPPAARLLSDAAPPSLASPPGALSAACAQALVFAAASPVV